MSGKALVIVVYIPFGWDDPVLHRRRFTEALASALLDQGAVLVVEAYICPTTGWYSRKEREKLYRALRQGRLRREKDNLYVLTPFVCLPVRWQHIGWIKKINNWILALQIQKTYQHVLPDDKSVISWFYRPEHVDLVGLAGENKVVYDCYDQHWEAANVSHDSRERIRRQEQQLLNNTDLVFVTSETLLTEKWRFHSNVHMACNAAAVAYFGRVQLPDTVVAETVRRLRSPVIGCLGTIHRHTDIALLKYVAKVKADWNILIVGPEQDTEFSSSVLFQQFRSIPNVHLTGWVDRDEVPGYFKAVDVCVIPYRTDSEFNKYVNPNKLHEYMAMGKPVVSTDIPCVRSHADIIYIARTTEEFVACIERALVEDGPNKIAERLRRAQENSWDKRAERMMEVVWEAIER